MRLRREINVDAGVQSWLSAWKLIPIEAHEVLDYAVGIASLTAPFVLGYRKRDLLISLFSDCRAYRRVGVRRR